MSTLTEQDLIVELQNIWDRIPVTPLNTITIPTWKVRLIKAAYAEAVREDRAIKRLGLTRKRSQRARSRHSWLFRDALNESWHGTIGRWEIATPASPFWRHSLIASVLAL